MSTKAANVEADVVKFTAILPLSTVRKIDTLKSFARQENRNKVITDAVEFMDFACKTIALAVAQNNEKALEKATQKVQDKLRDDLEDYWISYVQIYKEMPKP